jgi:DNA mismatch repair protein MutS2
VSHEFRPGDIVQTSFGKGRVQAVENGGRLVVAIKQRTFVVTAADVRRLDGVALEAPAADRGEMRDPGDDTPSAFTEIDLHGLVVEEALTRIDAALNDALLAGTPAVRFIHGRSGGRLRGALHRRLREISSVRRFALDPLNAGVTIVIL